MADGTRIYEPPVGQANEDVVDTFQVDYGFGDVRQRQRLQIAGATTTAFAGVTNADPASTDYGLVVRSVPRDIRANGAAVTTSNPLPTKAWLYDENGAVFSTSNPLPVDIGGATVQATFSSVDGLGNENQTPMAANAVFVGTWYDVLDYAAITAVIQSDVPSAANGVIAEFSDDGSNVIAQIASSYPGGNYGAYFAFPPVARYFRTRYINGPNPQSYLRSSIVYEFTAPTIPQAPLGATLTDASIGSVMRSIISGRQSTGVMMPLRATSTGQLATIVEGTVVVNKSNGHTAGQLRAASASSTAAQSNVADATRTVVIHSIPDGHSSSVVELTGFSPTSQVVFEQSETGLDGTWAATNMRRNNTPDVNENYSQIENNPFGTNNVQLWKGTVGGAKFFRIRCAALSAADAAAGGIGVTIETSEGVGGTFLLGNPPSVSDYFQTGTLANPGDTVECKAGGMGAFASLFSGQWTGKVQLEQTIDGTTWRPTRALLNSNGDAASFIAGTNTASQVIGARGTAAGVKSIRLRADVDFSGSLSGTLRCGAGSLGGFLTSAVQIGGLSQASQTLRQTVGTQAVRIDPSALTNRVTVEIKYLASNATNNAFVFVGFTSGVTTGTGRELAPGESWTLDVTSATQLWAIASAAGQQVQVTELG